MPGVSLGHDRCERALADLKRIAPQVVARLQDFVQKYPGQHWGGPLGIFFGQKYFWVAGGRAPSITPKAD
jgi:hypothetical protein